MTTCRARRTRKLVAGSGCAFYLTRAAWRGFVARASVGCDVGQTRRHSLRLPRVPTTAVRWLRDGWVLTGVLFLLAASFVTFFQWNQLHIDATAYWRAGTQLRTGGPLYAAAVATLDKAYLYPPAFAAAFAPITLLTPLWGYAVWMALEVCFALLLARIVAALAGLGAASSDARRTALAIALAVLIVPVFDNFAEGQVNLLVALLSAIALLEAERGRNGRAAFALAAAVHIKLVPIVLAGAFLTWRRVRLLVSLGAALVAVGLLPLVWRVGTMGVGAGTTAFVGDYADFGRAILWPAASASQIAGAEQMFAPNYSLRGTLSRLFVDGVALSPFPHLADRRGPLLFAVPRGAVDAASSVLGLAAIATALWTCRRAAGDPTRRVAAAGLLLLAGALAGPTFWQHHFVVLGVAGAGLWRMLASQPGGRRVLTWTGALMPLVVTITLPFFAALLAIGFDAEIYRRVSELGLPTAAAVAFFVVATVATLRR